jgi:hypothetical protein
VVFVVRGWTHDQCTRKCSVNTQLVLVPAQSGQSCWLTVHFAACRKRIIEERGLTAFARLHIGGPSPADRHVSASRIDTTSSVGAAHASDMRAHIASIASNPVKRHEAHSQLRNQKLAQQ